jgi:uncharacterized protein YkwD
MAPAVAVAPMPANGTAYTLFGELPALGAMPGAWTGLFSGQLDPKSVPLPQGFTLPAWPGLTPPSAPPSPAKPSVVAGTIALTPVEQALLDETNLRRARGATCGSHVFPPAAPLVIHDGLQKTAREHSEDMARRNYFEHQNPEGEGPGPRGRRYGYNGIFTGENIHMGSTNARDAVDSWMTSSGHCMNIMDDRYHYFGGASALGSSVYWTQNFGP